VTFGDNVFPCFDALWARQGDVIDLWASVQGLSLRAAALDLGRTLRLNGRARFCSTNPTRQRGPRWRVGLVCNGIALGH
jgi:hypothetical protein